MNPYALYPLTRQRTSTITGPIDEDISVAVYKVVDAVATFAGGITGAIRKWHKRNKLIRELSGLSDHLLKDIGISRDEIRAVVDDMLASPETRRTSRRPVVVANAPAKTVRPAAANDNETELAA